MMKLSFFKSDLIEGVGRTLKAVPSKTTMPILECIMIDASQGVITLMANDMELAIKTQVKGQIIEKGKMAIDAKLFSEIIRKLPDSEIIIEEEYNDMVRISCEKANFVIAGKRGDDFVDMPTVEKNMGIFISQFSLKETIRQTIFSIAANENNKLMTGELFEIEGNYLKVYSLDGHRISIRRVELKESYESQKVIVPGKTLMEISRILTGEREKDVEIYFSRNHIVFEFENTTVASRLIEGEYFRVNQMISGDYETKLTVNKKDFLDSIERSVLLIRDNDKKPIILNITDRDMEITMTSLIGSMKENMPVNKEGKDLMIGFNPKFLIDALRVIDDEMIDIYMVNSKAPCSIRDEAGNYIYLILPVNFSRA